MQLRLLFALPALGLLACGDEHPWVQNEPGPGSVEQRCQGLRLETLSDVAVPPANVAALVRVTTCDGAPLSRTLDESQFEILENGRLRSPFEARRIVTPLARATRQRTLVVVDLSGSVLLGGQRASMIGGVRQLGQALLSENHELAVYGFDGRPDLVPLGFFSHAAEDLEASLRKIAEAQVVDDSTNLHGAVVNAIALLDQAVKEIDKGDVIAQGNLVLFTDGQDLAARVSARRALAAVAASAHEVFTIGLGSEVDSAALADLGRSGAFFVQHTEDITRAFQDVSARLEALARRDYFVSYCTPARAGGHEVTIRAKDGDRRGEVSVAFFADGFGAGCRPEDVPLARF